MIKHFSPELDPFGRSLVLIYGQMPEINRRLKSLGLGRFDDTASGEHMIQIRPRGRHRTRERHIIVVARDTNWKEEESTLLHELTHMSQKALAHVGIGGSSAAAREVQCYYLEWQFTRCVALIRAAR